MNSVTIGPCVLYCGDCMDIFQTLEPVDAVVTDPPFGIGNFVQCSGNIRGKPVHWNNSIPPIEAFEWMRRISRHRVIWGANYFNCFEGSGALIWIKNQPMPDFSKAEIASVSWGSKVDVLYLTWTNYVNSKETNLPCERPVGLYVWSMDKIPEKTEIVLDPYMHSASVAIACIRTGRKFIGIEIDSGYFQIACDRIRRELEQTTFQLEIHQNSCCTQPDLV